MKLRIIDSYKKRVTLKSKAGLPLLDENGEPKTMLRTNYLYGVVGATPEEKALYKRFRMQDGGDYYREENGTPLYYSMSFIGREANLSHYTGKDGRVGFKVQTLELDILDDMIAKTTDPMLRAGYEAKKAEMLLAGGVLVLQNLSQKQVEEGTGTPESVSTSEGGDEDAL